jgi:hypothetical protein
MVSKPSGDGYYLFGKDGGIFTHGNAPFFGSEGGKHLNAPIVGMALTPSGNGYWLVASDGGVFSHGDATFFGSQANTDLNAPIVGITPTPAGDGYYLTSSDGGTFTEGNAPFFGSEGGQALNGPVVGMAMTPAGDGYALIASDGGVFAHGNALFLGGITRNSGAPVVGVAQARPAKVNDDIPPKLVTPQLPDPPTGFVLGLAGSYGHGLLSINLCGDVSTTPPQPGAHGVLTEIGPGGSLVQAITLDGSGTARSIFPVPLPGGYTLSAAFTVDGVTQQANTVLSLLAAPPLNTGTPLCPSPA